MNIEQKLLFARVGFTPAFLLLLSERHKPITERTAKSWLSGEKTPDSYYLNIASSLDEHLTTLAKRIVDLHDEQPVILHYYANDEAYWLATGDIPCPVSVYHQLLQRITILSPVVANGQGVSNISVGFDFGKFTKPNTCAICGNICPPSEHGLCKDDYKKQTVKQRNQQWHENMKKNKPNEYKEIIRKRNNNNKQWKSKEQKEKNNQRAKDWYYAHREQVLAKKRKSPKS